MAKAILSAPPASHVRAVRAFNRFYTQRIGVLQHGVLQSPYSLTEVRVLYELANGADLTATDVQTILGLDRGYLSRILKRFERSGMLLRERSKKDRRRGLIRLTSRGRRLFSALNARQSSDVERMLQSVPDSGREKLVGSMQTIQKVLNSEIAGASARATTAGRFDPSVAGRVSLRAHRPGDMGWVMFRHGVLYEREYGWDERFEALVGEIVVNFIKDFGVERERCWIAEIDGERVGSVFLVKDTATVAKLRLLLVEPAARGHGVGRLLVSECIDFARKAGYRKLTLWTNSVLDAARHIYESAGFELVKAEKHSRFGHSLTGQYWSLDLSAPLVGSASVHQTRLDRHA